MRKRISLLIAAMLFGTATSFAQGGTTGPLTWNISNDTLYISGNGAMLNYGYWDAPWSEYHEFIKAAVITSGVTSIGNCAFYYYSSLTSVALPNSIIQIGNNAFNYCSDLTSITLPDSLKSIGSGAFAFCYKLFSIMLPDSLMSIGGNAFRSCFSLAAITIPENVTSIGATYNGAFESCISLKTVNYNAKNCTTYLPYSEFSYIFYGCPITTLSIGDMVQDIPQYIFAGCNKITSITTHAIIPPEISSNAFKNVPKNIPVYVPCESYDSYMNAPGWGNYFTNISNGSAEIQKICMVSVNENNHNDIIWKKQDEVTVYKIYRKGIQSGQYDLVATFDYDSPNIWVDTESNAKIHSYSYAISAIGGICNRESALSAIHKTMHLTINAGIDNSWNIVWTAYEGSTFSTYNIYRSCNETMGEMELIGTMPTGNTSFSDFSAPAGYVYYMIEIMLNETCNVSKGSSIRSNIATNAPQGVNENTTIPKIMISPNPTMGELRIESGELRIENVVIYDVFGKIQKIENWKTENRIDISHLSTGIYFVKISTESGEVVRKVLKE